MSQNPPENGPEFDKGFLDSDVDLQIGSPPSSGVLMSRRSAFGLPSIPFLIIGFFMAKNFYFFIITYKITLINVAQYITN